ncbi:MAG: hypothetical protein GF320_00100 [Armatimonadia bacterium]|nr:hypothetical protein [Armatimonadia bacterium]
MLRIVAISSLLIASLGLVLGCARWPDEGGEDSFPRRVIEITVEFADPINSSHYYFICFDTDGDRDTGPLPIPEGPFWGNGWGTGVITAYVKYHAGQYRVYQPRVLSSLVTPGGGILEVGGNPDPPISGSHRLSIDAVVLGEATVEGTGMITGATNDSSQNAGELTVDTDASGNVVADSVAFTPAETGGRELTDQEQAVLDGLNAGDAALATDSLAALGITLQLGDPAAGSQALTIAPTTANVTDRFASYFGVNDSTNTGVLYANALSAGPEPVIDGVTFRTANLTSGVTVEIITQYEATEDDLGPPFDSEAVPQGGQELNVTVDLAQIGDPEEEIQFNIISTDTLPLNPEITLDKSYDGLGPDGTTFVTLPVDTNRTFENVDASLPELPNDVFFGALSEPDLQLGELDIVDWMVEVNVRATSAQSVRH